MFKRGNWEGSDDRNILDLNYTSVNNSSVEVTPRGKLGRVSSTSPVLLHSSEGSTITSK